MYVNIPKAAALSVAILAGGFFQSASAQDVVISLQSNPMSDPERACLAVTFARMLSSGETSADVTLFVTLDGVTLADESVVRRPRFKCDVPEPMDSDGEVDGVMSLQDNLEAFLDPGPPSASMLVCPLCWNSRYGEEELPSYGTKGNPKAMILKADKILDF